ncbi:MAG TPA: metal-sensitive transcriptional regulator [Candidatus Saccharimonadales bacterium]|nr:metal-sensitive transcriptional regulator [Candidatus Saccharimonadales bacterium]
MNQRYGYIKHKKDLLRRLARIEGQVKGVARMVGEERYCIDILTQISAIEIALRPVGLKVLDEHIRSCVTEALSVDDSKKAEIKTEELLRAVERFAKIK